MEQKIGEILQEEVERQETGARSPSSHHKVDKEYKFDCAPDLAPDAARVAEKCGLQV